MHVSRANMKGCQFSNNYDNFVITGPIALKLCMHVATHLAMHVHASQLGCFCTCARARVVPRSEQLLNPLRSNFVPWWGPGRRVACKSNLGPTLHVRMCRATVPDRKNGWTDCARIWYTDRDLLVNCCASRSEAPLRSSALIAGLTLSPQKTSYWYHIIIRNKSKSSAYCSNKNQIAY